MTSREHARPIRPMAAAAALLACASSLAAAPPRRAPAPSTPAPRILVTLDDLEAELEALDDEADVHEVKLDALGMKGDDLAVDSANEGLTLAAQEALIDVLATRVGAQDAVLDAIRAHVASSLRHAIETALLACAASCDARPAAAASHQPPIAVECPTCVLPSLTISNAHGGLLDDVLALVEEELPTAADAPEAIAYLDLARAAASSGDGELSFHLACRAFRAIACSQGGRP
jgi:hypothetical protein